MLYHNMLIVCKVPMEPSSVVAAADEVDEAVDRPRHLNSLLQPRPSRKQMASHYAAPGLAAELAVAHEAAKSKRLMTGRL